MGEVYDVAVLADTAIAFTDLASRSIFVLDARTGMLRQVGRSGTGPGEYLLPAQLEQWRGRLFFRELTSPFIKVISFDGIPLGEMAARGAPVIAFDVSPEGLVYALSNRGPAVYLLGPGGEILAASEAQVPEGFQFILQANYGGGICIDTRGYVYYVHAAPYVVHKLDGTLKEVASFDGASLPHYHKYPRELLGSGYQTTPPQVRQQLMRNASTILGLWYAAPGLLFVKVSDPTGRVRSFVDVWSTDGHHLRTFAARHYLAGVSSGYLVLVEGPEATTEGSRVTIKLLCAGF
ncbi:MAG: hypothetical protein QHJ34_11825 [bacterium]|nr:hypothetical protein [candidate division KSB1 bacterium]MDH7560902.1 hypothetical protein [bacterium]